MTIIIPKGEQVIATRVCPKSGQEFFVTDMDQKFYDQISPVFSGKKYDVPFPTLCPDERLRRRISWRNERNFYPRVCNATGRKLISSFAPEQPFPVYEHKYWWSDGWSGIDYGRNIDFDRPFFDQFVDLQSVVPQLPMINDNGSGSENCEYCYDFAFGKDCYFAIGMWQARDCLYTNLCDYGDRVVDCDNVVKSELCYECLYSTNLRSCIFLETSSSCSDCLFGIDLIGCRDCIFCIGLRQKQYCIFNKQYSKDEYEKMKQQMRVGSYNGLAKIRKRWEEFCRDFPRKPVFQVRSEASSGDMVFNCSNVHECHGIYDAKDCKYYIRADSPKNSYDIFNSGNPQWCYEGLTPDDSSNALFTTWCWKSRNILYSDNCHSSQDLFGCIGLKRQKNCILNTSYSRQEYEQLAGKLIEHMKVTSEWGEFFPMDHSPYPYNDSVAQDYFPIDESEARDRGWKWKSSELGVQNVSQSYVIPDDIADVELDICQEPLVCEQTGKAFKIQRNELGVYKAIGLPIPRLHPIVRRSRRLQLRNSHKLFLRSCGDCGDEVQTIYAPDRPEHVYCERCYQSYISQFPHSAHV